jgi:hypothetical protein
MSAGKTSGMFMLVEIKNTKLLKCYTYIKNNINYNNPNYYCKINNNTNTHNKNIIYRNDDKIIKLISL